MKKKISIAMTTFNGEKFLREQLDSLYAQTVIPDEVVAVDDGSTDSTLKILEEYHQRFGLQYFSNETRLGINLNFNRALSLCKGDYVAICDQDDIWLPEKIEKLAGKMEEVESQNPVLIVSDLILSDKSLRPLRKYQSKSFPNSIPLSILGNARQGCCMFLNRRLVDLILPIPDTPALHNNYDYYISVMGVMCGEKYYFPEPLMQYRGHGGNAVGNSISPNRSPIAVWIRGKTQIAYEVSISSQASGLKDVYQIRHNDFRPDRIPIYLELVSICTQTSMWLKIVAVWKSSVLSCRERMAITKNTILLSILLTIKQTMSKKIFFKASKR